MRTLAMRMITNAALAAGLPEGRVTDVSAADNLTLPRPRLEVDFLPDSLTRTGRKLIVTRKEGIQTTKKELYEVRFDLTARVYAGSSSGPALESASGDAPGDATWLESFENAFVAALPRGVNDQRGNWKKSA